MALVAAMSLQPGSAIFTVAHESAQAGALANARTPAASAVDNLCMLFPLRYWFWQGCG
nr:hypothetical protein FFPRI1PSEUD_02470 [Pseudomonas sp. FFPRI_1]